MEYIIQYDMLIVLYSLLIFTELVFLIGSCIYILMLVYSAIHGSFYVSTKQKLVNDILKVSDLQKGQYFLELGSGDGKVLLEAAQKYGVSGKGIDINPVLIKWANYKKNHLHLHGVEFKVEDVMKVDLSKADVIYIFLMPKLIHKIVHRLTKDTKRPVMVISHAFAIKELDNYLVQKLPGKPFPTYFYKVR